MNEWVVYSFAIGLYKYASFSAEVKNKLEVESYAAQIALKIRILFIELNGIDRRQKNTWNNLHRDNNKAKETRTRLPFPCGLQSKMAARGEIE